MQEVGRCRRCPGGAHRIPLAPRPVYVQCWGALRGCPCGGEAPPSPFTLVWHDAEVARRALAGVSVDPEGGTPYVDDVVRLLTRVGVTVELR